MHLTAFEQRLLPRELNFGRAAVMPERDHLVARNLQLRLQRSLTSSGVLDSGPKLGQLGLGLGQTASERLGCDCSSSS